MHQIGRYKLQNRILPVLLTGSLCLVPAASAQSTAKSVPDAQVEANVLKALAGAPELANQSIKTTTVYGVVTLSGSVPSETLRIQAETLASRASGVQKVVDELTLGMQASDDSTAGGGSAVADAQATNPNLRSDGTMAPADGGVATAGGSPDMEAQDNTGGASTSAPRQPTARPYGPPQAPYGQQPYGQPGYGTQQQQAYGNQQPGYQQPVYGGQQAGEMVTVPSGAMVRIRINQSLDSGRTQPGTTFDGVVTNDVVAGGAVAIPRGATVQGTVVSATKSGSLTGRGELSLQLTQVTLAGKTYPIQSDLWAHNGGDKTIETVNKTAVGGGIGALVGAAAGGGVGAAIGAGVGGALGLGSSAASGRGQVYVPSEGMLTFHLAQPTTVATVSQAEMDRLGQGVRDGAQPQQLRRRYYPQPYYGPAYYGPAYYRPYPY